MEKKITVAPSFWKSLKRLSGPGHIYRQVKMWFRYHFRKECFAILKEWWHGYPWEHSFLLKLERIKLLEMIAYHNKAQRFVGWEKVVRDMKICVSLIGIILEEKELFHYDGKLIFEPMEEKPDSCEVKHTPDFKYVCDIYVNTKNVDRFMDEKIRDFACGHPHELYLRKAAYLYHKIRYEHEQEWWD